MATLKQAGSIVTYRPQLVKNVTELFWSKILSQKYYRILSGSTEGMPMGQYCFSANRVAWASGKPCSAGSSLWPCNFFHSCWRWVFTFLTCLHQHTPTTLRFQLWIRRKKIITYSRLTNEHLQQCLCLTISPLIPKFKTLITKTRCHFFYYINCFCTLLWIWWGTYSLARWHLHLQCTLASCCISWDTLDLFCLLVLFEPSYAVEIW